MNIYPKNKKEFEKEMERRKELGPYDHRYRKLIVCLEDGRPTTKYDSRIVCEIQKLALGLSKKTWMECGPVEELSMNDPIRKDNHFKNAKYVRWINLHSHHDDEKLLDELFTLIIEGKRKKMESSGISFYTDNGSCCAFEGGCE